MNVRVELLQKIDEHLRGLSLSDYTRVTWPDGKMIRDFSLRMKRGDSSVWVEFLDYVRSRPNLKSFIYGLLEQIGWAQTKFDYDTSDLSHSLAKSPLSNNDQTAQATKQTTSISNPVCGIGFRIARKTATIHCTLVLLRLTMMSERSTGYQLVINQNA